MAADCKPGDCVEIPDGRIGRVRLRNDNQCKVRVRRKTSKSHQILVFSIAELKLVDCPKGWMSPEGYVRYLKVTLTKMRQREAQSFKPSE
jgi:hypothetical protein